MTILRKIWPLYLLLFSLAACSLDSQKPSNLNIKFDDSVFGVNPRISKKISAQSGADGDGPSWGLADPTSVGDINCYAIMVYGVEPELQSSSCSNQNDAFFFFGPRAGFYEISQAGQIEVLSGSNRVVYLLGMRAAEGVACPSNFSTNPDFDFSRFSNPFVIGQATVNLTSGDNVVQIPISSSFTNAKKIKDCNFFRPELDNQLVVTPHESKRTYWIDDEVASRTLAISHNGESLECSRDGGTTFGSCDTDNSLIWNASDIGATHTIRANYADGSNKTYNFTPSSHYPGLTIIPVGSCAESFSGSVTSSTAFEQYLSNPAAGYSNKFICFNDGASFEYSSAMISTAAGADSNVFIVREGDTATIKNNSTSESLFRISSNTHTFVGLTLIGSGSTSKPTIQVQASGSFSVQDGTVENIGDSHVIDVTAGSVDVRSSQIVGTAATSSSGLQLAGPSSSATVRDSSVRAKNMGLMITGGATATVESSEIVAAGGTGRAFSAYEDSTLVIVDSTIKDKSGLGARISAPTAAKTSTVTLEGNKFIRTVDNGGMLGPAIELVAGSGSTVLNSVSNNNAFCNESVTVPNFSGILTGTPTSGSFNAAINNEGNPIGLCE